MGRRRRDPGSRRSSWGRTCSRRRRWSSARPTSMACPRPAPRRFELGRARLDAGQPSAAAALMASALTLAPESELIRAHLAFARALGGDLDGAASALPPEHGEPGLPELLVRGYIAQARGD